MCVYVCVCVCVCVVYCRDEIFKVIDADIPLTEDGSTFTPFSVRVLLQYSALDQLEQISTISGMASKEYRYAYMHLITRAPCMCKHIRRTSLCQLS